MSTRRSLIVTAVLAGLVFLLMAGGLVVAFLRSVACNSGDAFPVTVEAQVAPRPEGVHVRMVVTAVRGDLPAFDAPRDQSELYYATKAPDRAHPSARGAISALTVDGARATTGQRIQPQGSTATLEFTVDRRPEDGRRVAWIPGRLKGLDVRSVTVDATEKPSTCLVPVGANANQEYVWFTECPAFPAIARSGPGIAPGYSRIDIGATIRVAYDPPKD